ncbi:acetyltransferase (GNAT) family protein [Mariniflexile fucanivorans]|uniref:Acetyltransferase (GNAT) family protein n=1 Tax=Mariniflexile fucanivorans TaxID=264023 RepID=A0A4R1RH38_9FLAO|nr:GNAT family N-acetyltransferase [Mariniflexile fucanivorans]TCL65030.1 acetyltransferase (GNAT) family protein [Mariniflexile fucanivorans]
MSLKKIHFLSELLQKHNIPSTYKTLRYEFNDKLFFEADNVAEQNIYVDTLCLVCFAFNCFLKPTFNNSRFKTIKITQQTHVSLSIIIPPNTTHIKQYLTAHFSKSSRAPIIKKMKRLESCFNIKYKVFYGSIQKKEYKQLMDKVHEMLVNRFKQRNNSNYILNDWNTYFELFFPLINEKKASIFVIYNKDTPIQISINFHFKKTFFAHIPAYDIDYAQFGLGNTAIYKQLEWCIENNYEFLDMGNGELDYKKRWCNYRYLLETHIFYKRNSLKASIIAYKELNIIKIKNFIKIIIKSAVYKKLKQEMLTKKNLKFPEYTIENLNETEIPKANNLELVDLKTNPFFKDIKKPLFNFIYNTKDHFDAIKIYKIKNKTHSFLILGTKKNMVINFNKNK